MTLGPVPAAPELPVGYRARPATLEDSAELRELLAAHGRACIGADDTTLDEVVASLTGPRCNLELDGLVVLDEDGQVVAWGAAFDEHDERGYVDVYVHPDLTQSEFDVVTGVLLGHCLHRLEDLARSRARGSVQVDAGSYRGERLQPRLVAAGFHHERVYLRMSVDLGPPSGYSVTPPSGVTISALDPTTDYGMRLAQELRNEVMKQHHGHLPLSFEAFRDRWLATAGYDATAWWLAELDTEPVGILIGDDSRRDDDAGFVRTLGVVTSARGRGIARALLLTAFTEYSRRGRHRVMLAVDSANETGATKLYESVGMSPVVTYDMWSLTLPVSSGPRSDHAVQERVDEFVSASPRVLGERVGLCVDGLEAHSGPISLVA